MSDSKEFNKIYYRILFNFNKLSNKDLNKQLKILQRLSLAKYLKDKFNDPRSIEELFQLINKEYQLKD